MPFDPEFTVYVWFDALLTYITGIGYGDDEALFRKNWPADIQFIGKDITRFHTHIWPAMLWAAGEEAPRKVFAHGFLNVGGQKMSKTNATGVHPFELIDQFGVDAYRYFFLREIPFGQDGNFSWEAMLARYNADLANGLGNLASRILAMLGSYFDGVVPNPQTRDGSGRLKRAAQALAERYEGGMTSFELTEAAAAVDEFVREGNRFLVEAAPWQLAKDPEQADALASSLYEATEALRLVALFGYPIMPTAAVELWHQLGLTGPLEEQHLPDAAAWGGLEPGTKTERGESLFPRLDDH